MKAEARQPTIGVTVDRAMAAIERDNTALRDVLPKDYARPALDKQRLGQLIDMITNIRAMIVCMSRRICIDPTTLSWEAAFPLWGLRSRSWRLAQRP